MAALLPASQNHRRVISVMNAECVHRFIGSISGMNVMLVLSRKTNERIVIGDGVELVVVAVQGNRVRLGVTAPSDTRISRSELLRSFGCLQSDEQRTLQLLSEIN